MPSGVRLTPRQVNRFWVERGKGLTVEQAAAEIKVSPRTGWNLNKRGRPSGRRVSARTTAPVDMRLELVENFAGGPVRLEDLCAEAKRALEDFGFFQVRYMGRIATPWQANAASSVQRLLESPDKEFLVENGPPGVGKTTTFAHDIPAWLTARNRAIRGQLGSNVGTSARRYCERLKRTLERTTPLKAEAEDLGRGLALDAVTTMADDFGSFRSQSIARELWTSKAFVVAQLDDVAIDEKEPTWSSFGFDEGYIGMRYDIIIWDDLVDKKSIRTAEAAEKLRSDWDDIAEKRLEPAGLLVLQGQRLGPQDLYRYCLDKRVLGDDGEETSLRKYHHIVFKAHDEGLCKGKDTHGLDAPYWPDGCLLDPRRLPWRELKAEMANPRGNFATIYQQEDVDPGSVLVDPVWVSGGTDPRTGQVFPGCWDKDRGACELPPGLAGDLVSYATVDPSPTKWCSVQWWVARCVDGEAQERYLMDLHRAYMDAPSLLDWVNSTQSFTGIMEEWQARSVAKGHPIRAWIVERNGAQRFLLQYEHCRRWMSKWQVDLLPHDTHSNKWDPQYGVETLAGIWKYGLVRLPGRQGPSWYNSAKLVEEATHWPSWSTDDCVMAQWFGEVKLPMLVPAATPPPSLRTASWLQGTDTHQWANQWRRAG